MPRATINSLPRKSPPRLIAVALFCLTVVTYIPSMTNGFIWDDSAYVIDNPTLKSADGLWRIWTEPTSIPQYYPMVHTTFWIEARLWGTEHAAGFHVDNILLHALAVVLLWRALLAIEVPMPWLVAAIFAVHPVMVESVAWVTERKNVLSLVFYLLAFLAYQKSENRRWYFASLLFFLLALFGKTVTCSLPAAILLIIWWKRGIITWRDVKPLLPMFAVGLFLSSVTSHLEHTMVGASGVDFQWSMLDRCLIAGHAVCFYGGKLVWPHPLIFMYPRWDLHADQAWQFIYPTAVVVVVAALWIARRWIGRGSLVAVLFFIGTLVPALGFVNVYPMRYSFVADHFQYLASIGFIVLIAAGLARAGPAAAIVLLPLAWLTWQQQALYKNAQTLWENTIVQNPTSWMAHVNLAEVYGAQKKLDAAMVQSQLAIQLAPNEADTQYNMGVALAQRSHWLQAADYFRAAIRCDSRCASAWADLARVLWEHFDSPEAKAEGLAAAQQALVIQPNLSKPHYVFGLVAESRGDLSTAIMEYGKALAINDKDFAAHYNLGNCLLQMGKPGEAAGEYQKVLAHDPRDAAALTNMGYANLSAGRVNDAASYFHQALQVDPGLTPAKDGLKRATAFP